MSGLTQRGLHALTQSLAHKTVITYPSLPEQTAIAEILSDMDAEIDMLAWLARSRKFLEI